jgi:hypothetical protein
MQIAKSFDHDFKPLDRSVQRYWYVKKHCTISSWCSLHSFNSLNFIVFLSKSYRELEVIQERECTYNVTLRHVCATIFVVERQLVLDMMNVCLYSCRSHTECKTHAPFLSVASLPLPHFSTLSHKRHNFIKKIRALIFSINFVRNNSHSKKNLKRYLS